MHHDIMRAPFSVTHRLRWCAGWGSSEDGKEETTIYSDGRVVAQRFKRDAATGRYRVAERATASVPPEEVAALYAQLRDLVLDYDGIVMMDDLTQEMVLSELGIRITFEGGLTKGEISTDGLVGEFLDRLSLVWETAR